MEIFDSLGPGPDLMPVDGSENGIFLRTMIRNRISWISATCWRLYTWYKHLTDN
jgi:hypothetical protein